MEIASAFVSLLPSARGFGSKLTSEVSKETSGSGKTIGGLFGKAFAGAAAIGVGAGVVGFFKDAVSGASDLAESGNKIDAIFGKASGKVQAFAGQGATKLGQTKLQVLDAAASFGTFGKAAGLSGGDLAKFSTGFTGLSTDMASFFNTSPDQAVEAIGAALRGEAEPIRKYGVLLDDATLRNEALKLGLIKTTKEALTPQQKVLAAQAAIYRQTKDAQGDFARTSGGLANQQRILSAQWSDMKTRVGAALLPVITKFITFLTSTAVPAISTVASWLGQNLGPVIEQVSGAFSGGGGLHSAVTAVVAAFTTQVLPVLQDVWGVIQSQVIPIVTSLAQFFVGTLVPAVIGIVVAVGSRLRPIFEQLVATYRERVLPTLVALLAKFREWQPTIQKVIVVVAKVIGWVLKLAASILGKVLPVVIRFAGWLLSKLVPVITTLIEWFAKIIGWVIKFGVALFNAGAKVVKFASSLREKMLAAVTFVASIPARILSALGNLGKLLYEAGRALIQGLINGITDKLGALKDKAAELANLIKDHFPGSPVKTGPLTSWNNGGAGLRLVEMLTDGMDAGVPAVAGASARLAASVALSGAGGAGFDVHHGGRSRVGALDLTQRTIDALAGGFGHTINSAAANAARRRSA